MCAFHVDHDALSKVKLRRRNSGTTTKKGCAEMSTPEYRTLQHCKSAMAVQHIPHVYHLNSLRPQFPGLSIEINSKTTLRFLPNLSELFILKTGTEKKENQVD